MKMQTGLLNFAKYVSNSFSRRVVSFAPKFKYDYSSIFRKIALGCGIAMSMGFVMAI